MSDKGATKVQVATRLQFSDFSGANALRCEAHDGFNHPIADWSPAMWALALAGEAGELCNKIKKQVRAAGTAHQALDHTVSDADVLDELADVVIYADLLATRMGADLGSVVARKWNKTSRKIGYCEELEP